MRMVVHKMIPKEAAGEKMDFSSKTGFALQGKCNDFQSAQRDNIYRCDIVIIKPVSLEVIGYMVMVRTKFYPLQL